MGRTTTDDVIEALALRATRARAKARELEGFYRKQLTAANAAAAKARGEAERACAERDERRAERDKALGKAAEVADRMTALAARLDAETARANVAEAALREARAALDVAHEHDAAEVARLRGLLGDVAKAWHHEAMAGDGFMPGHDDLYMRARSVARGES